MLVTRKTSRSPGDTDTSAGAQPALSAVISTGRGGGSSSSPPTNTTSATGIQATPTATAAHIAQRHRRDRSGLARRRRRCAP